ncbi:hypothetical protein Tco_0779878, partial [Tanacetum coccineum]
LHDDVVVVTFLCTPDDRVYAKDHVLSAGCGLGVTGNMVRKSQIVKDNVGLRRMEEINMKLFYDAWREFTLGSMHRAICHCWKAKVHVVCLMVRLASECEVRHGKSRLYAFVFLPPINFYLFKNVLKVKSACSYVVASCRLVYYASDYLGVAVFLFLRVVGTEEEF